MGRHGLGSGVAEEQADAVDAHDAAGGGAGADLLGRDIALVILEGARVGVAEHHRLGGERSEEHTSELQSLMRISYAVFCLKKKKISIITSSRGNTMINSTLTTRLTHD